MRPLTAPGKNHFVLGVVLETFVTCRNLPFLAVLTACTPDPLPPAAPNPSPKPSAAACVDARTCEAACLAGQTPSCAKAAKHMRASPVDADAKRLAAVLERACDGGEGHACVELTQVHRYAPSLTFDREKGERWIARACELGDPVGCITPAREEVAAAPLRPWEARPASSPGMKRGIELAQKRCDAGDGRSCAIATAMLQMFPAKGVDVAALDARAATLLEKSCEGGEVDDCEPAALQIAGPRFDGDPARVERMLSRGCELGDFDSCAQMAVNLPRSQQMQAEAILRKACERGGDAGCFMVALADRARGSEKWKSLVERGVRIARARCELADEEGCSHLAKSLPLIESAELDAKGILAFLRTACDRGAPQLCNDLADGVGALQPPLGSAALMWELKKQACDHGYTIACPDPIALLGVYVPLPVPIVDRRGGLEWSRSPEEGTAQAGGSSACEAGFRLPTKKELETLNAADRSARSFIRATSPPGARLLSSELSAGKGSAPLVFDTRTGQIDVATGTREIARCVRPVRKTERPARPVFTVRMSGPNLEYALRDKNDKVVTAATIVRLAEAYAIQPLLEAGAVADPVDVDIDQNVDWNLAARFLRESAKTGLKPRRVFIEGSR